MILNNPNGGGIQLIPSNAQIKNSVNTLVCLFIFTLF